MNNIKNFNYIKGDLTMKKRRSIIALFLAVVIAALGVGYAALTDTLTVEGHVTAPTFDTKLHFKLPATTTEGIVTDNKGGAEIVANVSTRGDGQDVNDFFTLTIASGFDYYDAESSKGDSITAAFTVVNENAYAVTVDKDFAEVTDNLPENKFTITVKWDDEANLTINAGQTKTGKLTITKSAKLDNDVTNATFSFSVKGTAVAEPTP